MAITSINIIRFSAARVEAEVSYDAAIVAGSEPVIELRDSGATAIGTQTLVEDSGAGSQKVLFLDLASVSATNAGLAPGDYTVGENGTAVVSSAKTVMEPKGPRTQQIVHHLMEDASNPGFADATFRMDMRDYLDAAEDSFKNIMGMEDDSAKVLGVEHRLGAVTPFSGAILSGDYSVKEALQALADELDTQQTAATTGTFWNPSVADEAGLASQVVSLSYEVGDATYVQGESAIYVKTASAADVTLAIGDNGVLNGTNPVDHHFAKMLDLSSLQTEIDDAGDEVWTLLGLSDGATGGAASSVVDFGSFTGESLHPEINALGSGQKKAKNLFQALLSRDIDQDERLTNLRMSIGGSSLSNSATSLDFSSAGSILSASGGAHSVKEALELIEDAMDLRRDVKFSKSTLASAVTNVANTGALGMATAHQDAVAALGKASYKVYLNGILVASKAQGEAHKDHLEAQGIEGDIVVIEYLEV